MSGKIPETTADLIRVRVAIVGAERLLSPVLNSTVPDHIKQGVRLALGDLLECMELATKQLEELEK